MKHFIHPELERFAVEITTLTSDPANARVHDERNIKAVMDSYREHGQRKPIVVQASTGIVVAGNGQVEAAKRLGWTHIAVLMVDDNDTEARKYALRDNRTAELAEWSLPVLGEHLRLLDAEGIDLESVGWESFESAPLMAAEWEPADQTGEQFSVPEKRTGLMFEAAEWAKLKELLGGKPTAAEVLKRLGAA